LILILLFVEDVKERMNPNWPMDVAVHDILKGPVPGDFDAAYALDVLEHIPAADEDRFIANWWPHSRPTVS